MMIMIIWLYEEKSEDSDDKSKICWRLSALVRQYGENDEETDQNNVRNNYKNDQKNAE